ncbi:MAG: NfeD family protein [Fimbriimonadaceae bacterium]
MLALYLVAAIVGGGLVLFSALGGLAHGGMDTDGGVDADHDVGGADSGTELAPAAEHDAGSDGAPAAEFWIPFTSLRFWTYLAAVFGVTGLALTLFAKTGEPFTLMVSILTGLVMGLAASGIVHWLAKNESQSAITEQDFLGAEARVLVPVRGSLPGKVRLQVKGSTVDLVAVAENDREIEAGEEVLVVGFEGNNARVARKEDYLR